MVENHHIYKEQLKTIIWESSLSLDEKDLWYKVISRMELVTIKALLDSLQLFPEDIVFLTEDLKGKLDAFSTLEIKKAEDVVAREREYYSSNKF